MSVTIRDDIYSGIAEQFPDFYKENGEFLVDFVKAYYQHNDATNDRDIPKLKDIDTTLTTFLVYYKKKYLADLPIDTALDVRFIIKHIQDMYKRKGTQQSLELMFRLFFDESIEIFYPSTAVLRPSDSIWGGDIYLEMKPVYTVDDYPIKKGNRIRGDISLATAFVDEVLFVNFSGSLSPIIYLSNIAGTFSSDDSIVIVTVDNNGVESVFNAGKLISGSISSVTVSPLNRLPSQRVGDTVKFKSSLTGIDGEGRVTKTSQTQTGRIEFDIEDGGFGYVDPTSLAATNNIGISNQVMIIDSTNTPTNADGTTNSNYVDFLPGDVIVCSGSSISYTGSSDAGATQYSVSGSAKVIEYVHPLLFIESNTLDEVQAFHDKTYPQGGNNINLLAAAFANLITPNSYNIPNEYFNYTRNFKKTDAVDGTGSIADFMNTGTVTTDDFQVITSYSTVHSSTAITPVTDFVGLNPAAYDASEWGRYLYRLFTLYSRFDIFPKFVVSSTPDYLPNNTGFISPGSGNQAGTTVTLPNLPNPRFTIDRHRGDSPLSENSPYSVTVDSFGAFNGSASYEIGELSNVETVTLVIDQIGDFVDEIIDENNSGTGDNGEDYGMSGPSAENYDTAFRDAFAAITVKIGTIDSLKILSTGTDYENNVKSLVIHDNIAKFGKRDIILTFDTVDFFLEAGDIITQNRTIEDVEINQSGNITESGLEALGASTVGTGYTNSPTTFTLTTGGTSPYTAKAKYIKRVDNGFYFRPLSFHGFDENLPVKIVNTNKNIATASTDPTSLPMGSNAVVSGVASYEVGQIDEISIIKTGYRYDDKESIEIVNIDEDSAYYNKTVATASIRTLSQGKTEGRWKTKTSFLSDKTKRLHDNNYYQEYSYDISSIVDPKKYEPLIEDTVGVAGTKLFSTPMINSDNNLDSDLSVLFTFYEIRSGQLLTTDGDFYVDEDGNNIMVATTTVAQI